MRSCVAPYRKVEQSIAPPVDRCSRCAKDLTGLERRMEILMQGADLSAPIRQFCLTECAPIHVFAMNDCDHVAAKTWEEAKQKLMRVMSLGEGDCNFEDGNPEPLSDQEMETFQFTDLPETGVDTRRTFREQLDRMIRDGEQFPCYFAGTEY